MGIIKWIVIVLVALGILNWISDWIGEKMESNNDDDENRHTKEPKAGGQPLSDKDVISVCAKMYNCEFAGHFNSARKLTSQLVQNRLAMHGKTIAIFDTIISIDGDSKEARIRMGDGEYYRNVDGSGDPQLNDYVCVLDPPSVEHAKALKAGDFILVIGVLGNRYGGRILSETTILKAKGKYIPEIENHVRHVLKNQHI